MVRQPNSLTGGIFSSHKLCNTNPLGSALFTHNDLDAQADPQETTAEILAEARIELIRWATEQIRSEFSEATWNAFWRTAIEGVPIAEVAKSTGRSAGAVYVARYRVIARLKEKVLEVSQLWDLQENQS